MTGNSAPEQPNIDPETLAAQQYLEEIFLADLAIRRVTDEDDILFLIEENG